MMQLIIPANITESVSQDSLGREGLGNSLEFWRQNHLGRGRTHIFLQRNFRRTAHLPSSLKHFIMSSVKTIVYLKFELLLAWYLHVCKRTCDFSHLFAYHQTDSLLLQARRLERIVDPLHRVSLSDCHPQPNLGSLRALLSWGLSSWAWCSSIVKSRVWLKPDIKSADIRLEAGKISRITLHFVWGKSTSFL